jgi:hypothetical protein
VFVLEDGFTYQTASEIDSVTPNEGQEGTAVTIEGSNLLGKGAGDDEEIVSAKLGDAEATVEFSNGTYILLTATNSSGGDFDVTLEATSGATTVLADGFTYLQLGSVTEVEPATGQVGTLVTISGDRLWAVVQVPRLSLWQAWMPLSNRRRKLRLKSESLHPMIQTPAML